MKPVSINTYNTFPFRSNATLYVPYRCKAKYEAASYWEDFKEIVELEPDYIIGDANGDAKVDVNDSMSIVNYLMGNAPAGFNAAAADVNGDGMVDIADAVAVLNSIMNGSE